MGEWAESAEVRTAWSISGEVGRGGDAQGAVYLLFGVKLAGEAGSSLPAIRQSQSGMPASSLAGACCSLGSWTD